MYIIGRSGSENGNSGSITGRSKTKMEIPEHMPRVKLRYRRWPRIALIIVIGYAAFYLSAIDVRDEPRYYSYSLSEGGAVVGWDLRSLWGQTSLVDVLIPPAYHAGKGTVDQKVTGLGAALVEPRYALMSALTETEARASDTAIERQVIRSVSLHLLVSNPAETVERIGALTVRLGGYVLTSQIGSGRAGERGAVITVRVPASRLDEARAEIRKLAVEVVSERTDAKDVTKDFVDKQSTLRNYRAEEAQYLTVMKRAVATKDILDVSEKLSDVRGRIEKLQGELQYLSHQVAMATITVYLDAESQAQVFGLHWRPLYRIKVAARGALEAVGSYFSIVVALVLRLPVILLWLVTLFVLAAWGWKLLRWMAKLFFPKAKPPTTRTASSVESGPTSLS